jgi:hypothetical protein
MEAFVKSVAETEAEVLSAVFADRNRSVESAVARGIQAGVALERARIRAIFEMPMRADLQKAVTVMALHGCSAEAVRGLVALYEAPVSSADVAARRKAFRVIRTTAEENSNA